MGERQVVTFLASNAKIIAIKPLPDQVQQTVGGILAVGPVDARLRAPKARFVPIPGGVGLGGATHRLVVDPNGEFKDPQRYADVIESTEKLHVFIGESGLEQFAAAGRKKLNGIWREDQLRNVLFTREHVSGERYALLGQISDLTGVTRENLVKQADQRRLLNSDLRERLSMLSTEYDNCVSLLRSIGESVKALDGLQAMRKRLRAAMREDKSRKVIEKENPVLAAKLAQEEEPQPQTKEKGK